MPEPATIAARQLAGKSNAAEASINWEDDAGAIANLRESPNARHGVVRLEAIDDVLELLARNPALAGALAYERDALPDNQYHGNLLFSAGHKEVWGRVANILAAWSDPA